MKSQFGGRFTSDPIFGIASFEEAKFESSESTNIGNMHARDCALFSKMTVSGTLYLGNSTFEKLANFSNDNVLGEMTFSIGKFKGPTTVDGTRWARGFTFEDTTFDIDPSCEAVAFGTGTMPGALARYIT